MMFIPREKGLGAENFLKLNDKEEVSGVFVGDLYRFKRHWVNGRGSECPGEGCSFCDADAQFNATEADLKKHRYAAFRFRVNFVTTKDGQWVAKIFEGGAETYDLLVSLDGKFDLSKTVVDITRMGLKQNTKYNILPRLDQPITKEMKSKIDSVTLIALVAEKKAAA
jgi:hypothetical protein